MTEEATPGRRLLRFSKQDREDLMNLMDVLEKAEESHLNDHLVLTRMRRWRALVARMVL